jgi:DMSO/TMAO reductase YedYZ molybdopterin-dependent catalytic subunit
MTKKVSRRHFLRQAALSGAAAVLAACTASPEKTTGLESSPTASKTGVSPVDTATVPAGLEPGPTATVVGETNQAATPGNGSGPVLARCDLAPVIAPTQPAKVPRYTELDETTGLHMTGTPQAIDLASYRLKVHGLVDHPLNLTLDDLRCLPKITASPELVCPGFFLDEATWAGASMKAVLEMAGIQSPAEAVWLTAGDKKEAYVLLENALKEENFLAYEWAGQPLPILHGFPVRSVLPSTSGTMWVKWLVEIRVE